MTEIKRPPVFSQYFHGHSNRSSHFKMSLSNLRYQYIEFFTRCQGLKLWNWYLSKLLFTIMSTCLPVRARTQTGRHSGAFYETANFSFPQICLKPLVAFFLLFVSNLICDPFLCSACTKTPFRHSFELKKESNLSESGISKQNRKIIFRGFRSGTM